MSLTASGKQRNLELRPQLVRGWTNLTWNFSTSPRSRHAEASRASRRASHRARERSKQASKQAGFVAGELRGAKAKRSELKPAGRCEQSKCGSTQQRLHKRKKKGGAASRVAESPASRGRLSVRHDAATNPLQRDRPNAQSFRPE